MLPSTPFSLPYLIEIFIASTVAALYYTALGLEISKNVTDRQTNRQRTEISITEVTLIPWIAGLRGPKIELTSFLL